VHTHFTEFAHLGCVDSLKSRNKLKKELHAVLNVLDGTCALTGLPTVSGGGSLHSVSLNRIDNDSNYIASNVQVTSYVANMTFGNHPNDLAHEFFLFFSTHIAAGDFDPTADVIPQLMASPLVTIDIANVHAIIVARLDSARQTDVKKFGTSDSTCTVRAAIKRLELQIFRCSIAAVALTFCDSLIRHYEAGRRAHQDKARPRSPQVKVDILHTSSFMFNCSDCTKSD
jgi:hypothetical protein